MQFLKMQGAGNDFVVLDCLSGKAPSDPSSLARRACDRHFGVGGDGLVLILPSAVADARMRIFNADGSEPEMCGNAIRCVGKFLHTSGARSASRLTVETLGGIKTLELDMSNDTVRGVTVDMGKPELSPAKIPVCSETNEVSLAFGEKSLSFFCVSMGNPHAVTFDLYPDGDAFSRLGPLVEAHPAFPQKTNVEFVRILDRTCAQVKVWERGCGATMACGTGASAVLVAGVSLGLLDSAADLRLPGGTLHIQWTPGKSVYMTGPAELSFVGELPDA